MIKQLLEDEIPKKGAYAPPWGVNGFVAQWSLRTVSFQMFPQEGYEKREPFAVRSERFRQIEIDNARNQTEKVATLPEGDEPPFVQQGKWDDFWCALYIEFANLRGLCRNRKWCFVAITSSIRSFNLF